MPILITLIIAGVITATFIILELKLSIKRFDNLPFYKKIQPWILIWSFWPLISDVGMTLLVIRLFSIGGSIPGMAVSLVISAMLSCFFFFSRDRNVIIDPHKGV